MDIHQPFDAPIRIRELEEERKLQHCIDSMQWVQIAEIQKEANALGYWMLLKSPFEPNGKWHAGFTPHLCSGWNGVPDYRGSADTALEAAQIALKSLKEAVARD